MNPKFEKEYGYYGCMYLERRKKEYTFEDMQNDMDKINADIDSLRNMDIDSTIKLMALADLKDKKHKLLGQMHEKLNEMYS